MIRNISDDFLELMAERFQMLADPTRLAILRTLMEGEKSVGEIVELTEQGQANVSKHLRLLSQSGLVSRRKDGLKAFYSIQDPVLERICNLVCKTMLREADSASKRLRRGTK